MTERVYILGGYQTDFSRNWDRDGLEIIDGFRDVVEAALDAVALDASEIDVAHVGNFVAELFCRQGHLGGMFAALNPAFSGIPASRHEAACASGSIATLAAAAEIEAGRYGLAAVVGIEQMRNVPGQTAAEFIGQPAMWAGHECTDNRYGIRQEHLAEIAKINFANAKRNPNAQTRRWRFTEQSFQEHDDANPVIEGRIRKHDCGQITDGAACVFLASSVRARDYADRRAISVDDIPYIKGWGHRTAPISYQQKIDESRDSEYVFPHVRGTITDAFDRAGMSDVGDIDGIETHDCFTSTEYMAIDHFGITAAGESWKAVEEGAIELGGRIPVNASGGLIGLGHPVGATGVRMVLDSYKQVTGGAGDYQIEGARDVATLNIGGSATTTVSFVIGR
jgi:acetyl-CoA C-acetyltransferase